MTFDRDDFRAGRCTSFQINAETLEEHQRRLVREGRMILSREEAKSIFPAAQVERWFQGTPDDPNVDTPRHGAVNGSQEAK